MQVQEGALPKLPGADSPKGAREFAWNLVCEWNESDSLRKHALAVEIAMRAYARHYGEDEERWGVTGLLHDLDYEKHPDLSEHPMVGVAALQENGYPQDVCDAILGHGDHTGTPRETLMAKTLFAVDELTGFISAVALVRPSKQVADVEVKSIKKKLKDKAFARGCNREEMAQGARELGVEMDEHIALVLKAMQDEADLLGL